MTLRILLVMILFTTTSLFSAQKYDFRKVRWGMTESQVKNAERQGVQIKNAGWYQDFHKKQTKKKYGQKGSMLSFTSSVAGHKAKIVYFFRDNKAVRCSVDINFPDKRTTKKVYKILKRAFKNKYGIHTRQIQRMTSWHKRATRIRLHIRSRKIIIDYNMITEINDIMNKNDI